MRRLSAFVVAGLAATAVAGTAVAAAPRTHNMDVSLPDGGVAHIEYVGDIAPKVTIAQRPMADAGDWAMPFPSFASFDRMMQDMQRQSQEMMRRAQQMSRAPTGAAPYIASYGSMPAGETSTTMISVSNNGATCTRTTQVISEGPGKAPKVTSNMSGQCGGASSSPSGPTHPA